MISYVKLSTWSTCLGMCVPVDIMLPDALPQGQEKAKVLYLLHGLSDDETCWGRRTNLERYIDGRGLCVVMPAAHRSFYTDFPNGMRYWQYVSEELPDIIKRFFNVSQRREDTFAGGISMGGYGSMKLALRHPERYSVVISISGALTDMKAFPEVLSVSEYEHIFGHNLSPADDVLQLLDNCADSERKPRILQFCGQSDFFEPINVSFFEKAQELGYDISYFEEEGNHGWPYWDRMISLAIDMLCPIN